MIHDLKLVDQLSKLKSEAFSGHVFRATGVSIDPTAPSISGGRWAMPPNSSPGTPILYTSLIREGAIAELCSFLIDLTPLPTKPIKVSKLRVTASHVVSLSFAELAKLGLIKEQYGQRDYRRTQEIGAALSFLGFDGLIAPSARWPCENLMLFCANHAMTETLEVASHEVIDWKAWATDNGITVS